MSPLPLRDRTAPLHPQVLYKAPGESACSVPIKSLMRPTAPPCKDVAFSLLKKNKYERDLGFPACECKGK